MNYNEEVPAEDPPAYSEMANAGEQTVNATESNPAPVGPPPNRTSRPAMPPPTPNRPSTSTSSYTDSSSFGSSEKTRPHDSAPPAGPPPGRPPAGPPPSHSYRPPAGPPPSSSGPPPGPPPKKHNPPAGPPPSRSNNDYKHSYSHSSSSLTQQQPYQQPYQQSPPPMGLPPMMGGPMMGGPPPPMMGPPPPGPPMGRPQLHYPPGYHCAKCNNTGIKKYKGTTCKECFDKFGVRSSAQYIPSGLAPVFNAPPRVVPPGDPSIGGWLCGRCRGSGIIHEFKIFENTCPVCHGVGRVF